MISQDVWANVQREGWQVKVKSGMAYRASKSRVPDQIGVSLLYIVLEIHHIPAPV